MTDNLLITETSLLKPRDLKPGKIRNLKSMAIIDGLGEVMKSSRKRRMGTPVRKRLKWYPFQITF
jgi:hypothetical protein